MEQSNYLERKKRVKDFYASPKLKGVRRLLNGDEFFDTLFDRKPDLKSIEGGSY